MSRLRAKRGVARRGAARAGRASEASKQGSTREGQAHHNDRMTRQRGSAMLVTLIVITALMAGAAVLVGLQMSSNRATEVSRTGTSALYCAEAGLSAARSVVVSNYSDWATWLGGTTEPTWLASIDHDVDKDGVGPDFEITIKDNDDETTIANDPKSDNDLRVFIVSKCIKYPDNPKAVMELVRYSGQGKCYNSQESGCGQNNNEN